MPGKYNLIFIPSGSFGHLISQEQVDKALRFIAGRLNPGGKFVFEIETLKAVREPQRIWRGRWINRPDGSKIVMYVLSHFDPVSRVNRLLSKFVTAIPNCVSLRSG